MINRIGNNNNLLNNTLVKKKDKTPSFSDTLEKYIESVNNDQIAAQDSITKFLKGETKDVHSTIISIEKAEVSLQMMLQLRNKVIQGYQEIMRIQV